MAKSGQRDFRQEAFVHITYEVEKGNAESKREIPFVMGVMADLMGKSDAIGPLAERKVTELSGENFDTFQRKLKPKASFRVKSTFDPNQELPVALTFESMSDFAPAGIAKQIPQLAALLEQRNKLRDLLAYMDGKAKAEEWLAAKLDLDKHPELKALVEKQRAEQAAAQGTQTGEEG